MGTQIHPTALIEPGAELDTDVTVGAFAYIGACVKVGKNTCIHHHATVDGDTEMGEDNEVFPYAYIGAKTHDLKYTGGAPGLKIGDRNVFREYVSVHLATLEGTYTTLASDNVLLAYSHVAHECQIANHLVMSSHAALGGHVIVGDHVNIGWGSGVHQFCQIGAHAMVGACSKVVQDVMPFMIADGNAAAVRTVNKVGLERRGFSEEERDIARFIFKTFHRQGLNRSQALAAIQDHPDQNSRVIQAVLDFVNQSERGLA